MIASELKVTCLMTLQPGAQEKLQDATLQHLMQQQEVLQLYRSPGLSGSASAALLRKVCCLSFAAQLCLAYAGPAEYLTDGRSVRRASPVQMRSMQNW